MSLEAIKQEIEKEIKRIDDEIKELKAEKEELLNKSSEYLCLKWGTLKHWDFKSEKAKKLIEEYSKIGFSGGGRMMQEDTDRQKQIICELIDIGDFKTVLLDWDNKRVSKKKAKEYVLNYGKDIKYEHN
jgi:hypothetical protein